MLNKVGKRVTFANVISLVALFIALGGSAYAALAKNSVGTKQLKNNAVTSKKVKNGAITAAKLQGGLSATPTGPAGGGLTGTYPNPDIINNGVTTGKIANNAVTLGKIADQAVSTSKLTDGAVTSAKIGAGEVHSSDLGPITVRTHVDANIPTATSDLNIVSCNTGEIALSAGGQWSGPLNSNVTIQAIVPNGGNNNIWGVTGRNNSGGNLDFTAYVYCLQA